MALKSSVMRMLLALLLVFSQQQAVLHLLGHGLAQLSRDQTQAPEEPLCAKCLAIAHLDHAVAGDVPSLVVDEPAPESAAPPAAPRHDPAFIASYRSRAPPIAS